MMVKVRILLQILLFALTANVNSQFFDIFDQLNTQSLQASRPKPNTKQQNYDATILNFDFNSFLTTKKPPERHVDTLGSKNQNTASSSRSSSHKNQSSRRNNSNNRKNNAQSSKSHNENNEKLPSNGATKSENRNEPKNNDLGYHFLSGEQRTSNTQNNPTNKNVQKNNKVRTTATPKINYNSNSDNRNDNNYYLNYEKVNGNQNSNRRITTTTTVKPSNGYQSGIIDSNVDNYYQSSSRRTTTKSPIYYYQSENNNENDRFVNQNSNFDINYNYDNYNNYNNQNVNVNNNQNSNRRITTTTSKPIYNYQSGVDNDNYNYQSSSRRTTTKRPHNNYQTATNNKVNGQFSNQATNNNNDNNYNTNYYTTQNPFYNNGGVRPTTSPQNKAPYTNKPKPSQTAGAYPNDVIFFPKETDATPEFISGRDEDYMTQDEKRKYREIAERACDKYKSLNTKELEAIPLVPSPTPIRVNVTSCAPANVPLVVGGKVVTIKEYPHMALVGWEKLEEPGYSWKCGGSLISDQWVLTAAHCSYLERDNTIVTGPPRAVQLGSSFLDDYGALVVNISSVVRHPKYKSPKSYYDIALLKLRTTVRFSEVIKPACLGVSPAPGKAIVATGWGRTEYGGIQSHELRSVSLPVVDMEVCRKLVGTSKKLPNGPSADNQVCAGEMRGGKDTCQGDSGGPAQLQEGCIWRVVAVTSVGKGCGAPNTPGLYATVQIPFISAHVFANEINSNLGNDKQNNNNNNDYNSQYNNNDYNSQYNNNDYNSQYNNNNNENSNNDNIVFNSNNRNGDRSQNNRNGNNSNNNNDRRNENYNTEYSQQRKPINSPNVGTNYDNVGNYYSTSPNRNWWSQLT